MWKPLTHRSAALALAAVLTLGAAAGCGDDQPAGDDSGGPTTPGPTAGAPETATPSPTASPTADVELLEYEISGGRADPPLERVTVDRGTRVRIVVTSDEPDEIHLHGYDLEAEVAPGEEGVIEFVADQDGLFELETHHTQLVLLQLVVQ